MGRENMETTKLSHESQDLVNIQGYNLYYHDIEEAIYAQQKNYPQIRPGCAAAFSIKVSEPEKLVIFQEINPNPNGDFITNQIADIIRKTIEQDFNISVHSIVLLAPGILPKTSSRKVIRFACKKAFLSNFTQCITHTIYQDSGSVYMVSKNPEEKRIERILSSSTNSFSLNNFKTKKNKSTEEKIQEYIIDWLCQENEISHHEISLNKNFLTYDIDSIRTIELCTYLEKHISYIVPETLIWDYPSIKELSQFLAQELEKRKKFVLM